MAELSRVELRYVMYFRFCGCRHVYTRWLRRVTCIPKLGYRIQLTTRSWDSKFPTKFCSSTASTRHRWSLQFTIALLVLIWRSRVYKRFWVSDMHRRREDWGDQVVFRRICYHGCCERHHTEGRNQQNTPHPSTAVRPKCPTRISGNQAANRHEELTEVRCYHSRPRQRRRKRRRMVLVLGVLI